MMNRRWFFTTAGSAFLTAACTTMSEPNPKGCKPTAPGATPDAKAKWDLLITNFVIGLKCMRDDLIGRGAQLTEAQYPSNEDTLRRKFEPRLERIYGLRFKWRVEEKADLTPEEYQRSLAQACVLGQLTGLCWAFHTGVANDGDHLSFENRAHASPVLDDTYIDWARDTYGFYTNGRIGKKPGHPALTLCGETRQIDEPCPICAPLTPPPLNAP